MRHNSRKQILDAAVRVVEASGVRGLTLEATAEEAGLTRGGMMYHFADRDSLLTAVHRHVADHWDQLMVEALGVPLESASQVDMAVAYVRVATSPASPGMLALALEAQQNPATASLWRDLLDRWTRVPGEPADLHLNIARLAADGLWVHEAIGGVPLTPDQREQAAEAIIGALRNAAPVFPDSPSTQPRRLTP